jgi:phage protein D
MSVDYANRAVIEIDGATLDAELEAYLEEVVVDDHVQLPQMFTLTLLDPARDILDRTGLRVGATVQVSAIAQADHPQTALVKGDVVSIDCDYSPGGAEVIVRGYASSHKLHRGRKTRTFVNVTDSEIVKRVAQESSIELGNLEPTSEVYEHVAQPNISDWEFIKGRAARIGYDVWLEEGKLCFGQPRLASEAPAPATEGPDGAPTDPRQLAFGKNLREFRGRLSAAEQVGEIEVRAWDSARKEPITASARAGTVSAELEMSDPDTMASFFGDAPFVAVRRPLRTPDLADAVAKALAERIGSAFAEAEGVAGGHPELRAGTAVSVSGVGDDFSGKYVLSHVRHVIDREGYQTHFTVSGRQNRSLLGMVSSGATAAAPATGGDIGGPPAFGGLVRGIVDDNADPENLGRVKVRLPWLNADFSSNWAPVMQLGAGPDSGTLFIPAVNDEVLVGFEHGDVDWPVVVGGLFNATDKPPAYSHVLDNGSVHRRSIVSRLGHQIALSDDPNNESGIAIVTKDATVAIGLNARDKMLTVVSHGDVEIKAGGEMKLSGSKITVQADGELVLKGTQIKLN